MAAPHLLVVFHSRSGTTRSMCDAVVAGAEEAASDAVERRVLAALDAGVDDVLWASAVVLGTPARFGAMSGLMKDFLERIDHPCLERTAGLPYGLFVKGDTDVDGAVTGVERIATGLRWRRLLPPVVVVGDLTQDGLDAGFELGATIAAGLESGMW